MQETTWAQKKIAAQRRAVQKLPAGVPGRIPLNTSAFGATQWEKW